MGHCHRAASAAVHLSFGLVLLLGVVVPRAAWATECVPHPCCADKQAKEPPCPAAYKNLRFDENWRPCLCKDPCDLDDWSDRAKARRLTRNGFLWASLGGQVRTRWESFSNIGFGAPADHNDAWLLARGRAHADLHFGEHARIYVEGIYANQYERRELGPRPIDVDRGDVLNLFAEVNGTLGSDHQVGLWAGRRELQTGKQRLVSPLDWANTRRTFEGVGGWWSQRSQRVDAWFSRPVTIEEGAFNNDGNEDVSFWGVNYKNDAKTCRTWEVYAYGLRRDATATVLQEDRYTIGARIDGVIAQTRFDYDAEAAVQLGERGNRDVFAYMASATVGWKPCMPCWDPRIAIGLDVASGDDDPSDTDVGTFDQLFPLAHKYLGHADVLARQNILAARIGVSSKPSDKLTLNAWFHMFWRADEADAVYNAAGGVLRAVPVGGNSQTAIGSELDIKATYKLDRHWTAFAEWAHFFAGDFIESTGPSKDIDVFYLGIQGTF